MSIRHRLEEITLYQARTHELRVSCYEADRVTPLVVQSADVFRCKIWSTDEAAPEIEIESIGPESQAFTVDAGTDVVTSNAHGRDDGDAIHLRTTGTLPAGLSLETTYYVRDATANTFKLAATAGGAAIDITGAGSGTHTWVKDSHITVESLGVANTSPATILVRIGQFDLARLDEGDYEIEFALVDDDDDDAIKVIARGPLRVQGSATGDVGIT